jgi:mannose-6-phosphate isomerase-like protein (cupin superfamily)
MTLQDLGKNDKGWGFEIVWSNNDKYSGKLLVFEKAGNKTSLVFHKDKQKSWFVNSGRFKMRYVDVQTGELKEAILEEGKTADIGELTPHQLEALVDGSVIFEVATTDNIEDRFRLAPGDTQTKQSTQ